MNWFRSFTTPPPVPTVDYSMPPSAYVTLLDAVPGLQPRLTFANGDVMVALRLPEGYTLEAFDDAVRLLARSDRVHRILDVETEVI